MVVPPVFALNTPAAPSEHPSSGRCWRARGASSRLWVLAVELRREGGGTDQHGPEPQTHGAENHATPPRAPVLRSSSSIVRGARWRAHGPRGGVVEVIRASTADLACAVVACGATQPPASPKHACDSLRPRGAPYRAPAYPGEGGEGGKHRESTGVFNSPRLSERTQGLAC